MSAGSVETRPVPTMEFMGVTTGSSSIIEPFPRWARVLALAEARLEGRDLPLGAEPDLYRSAVEQIRCDPLSMGALVTTHKIRLLATAISSTSSTHTLASARRSRASQEVSAWLAEASAPLRLGRVELEVVAESRGLSAYP
jgi:hypothetical protein